MINKRIVRHYDNIAANGANPCWDVDCIGLGDFDKGVILSLMIKKIICKPRNILKFIRAIDSVKKLMGLLLSHLPFVAGSTALKRYFKLYETAKSRRDFRYEALFEYKANNCKILDAGCGLLPIYNALSQNNKLYGVDIANQMLRMRKNKNKAALLANADIKSLPFKANEFQISSCFGVFPLYKDISGFLKELARVTQDAIIFDVFDSKELPYISPWYLASFWGYYFGAPIEFYQHSISEINRAMQSCNFYLYSQRMFRDGISSCNKLLIFKKK